MEMTFVHWKVTKAVNFGENLITRGGSNATPEQQLGAAFPYNLGADIRASISTTCARPLQQLSTTGSISTSVIMDWQLAHRPTLDTTKR